MSTPHDTIDYRPTSAHSSSPPYTDEKQGGIAGNNSSRTGSLKDTKDRKDIEGQIPDDDGEKKLGWYQKYHGSHIIRAIFFGLFTGRVSSQRLIHSIKRTTTTMNNR